LNTLSKEEYTILESRTIKSLKEQNYYLPNSERGRNIIKEEMVKILVEEKEALISQDRLNDPKAEYIDFEKIKKN
jgi:hypothetical protein